MEINVTNISNCEKSIEITAPYSETEKEEQNIYQEYQKNAKVEGFRKGKVPIALIKKMFGKTIEEYLIDKLVNKYYNEAITKETIKPIGEAKVQDVKYNENEGLHFIATIETEPTFELAEIDGIKLQKKLKNITKEEIDEEMEKLRHQFGTKEKVEDGAQIGHYILADVQMIDPQTHVPLIGKRWDDRYFILGHNALSGENAQQLIGARIGENRIVTTEIQQGLIQQAITQPGMVQNNPQTQSARNNTESFLINIKNIERINLPELDDEFAKDVGENFKTLEDLNEHIKKVLEVRAKFESNEDLKKQVENEIIRRHEFNVPNIMIENYINQTIKDLKKGNIEKIDEEYIKSNFRDTAIRNIKWYWIREKLIEKNTLKVEEEEIEKRIDEIAKINNVTPEKARITFRSKQSREKLKEQILDDKLYDFLLEKAQIEDITI